MLKKTVVIQWKIWTKKDLKIFAFKFIEKIIEPSNAKEYYQLFPRNENTKSVKQSKIINKKGPKINKNKQTLLN